MVLPCGSLWCLLKFSLVLRCCLSVCDGIQHSHGGGHEPHLTLAVGVCCSSQNHSLDTRNGKKGTLHLLKVVLQGSPRSSDIHDLSEYHRLYRAWQINGINWIKSIWNMWNFHHKNPYILDCLILTPKKYPWDLWRTTLNWAPTKPFSMFFYSPVWHLNFFFLHFWLHGRLIGLPLIRLLNLSTVQETPIENNF